MSSYGMDDRDKKALKQFESGEFCYSFQKKIIVNAIFSFWSVNPQANDDELKVNGIFQ